MFTMESLCLLMYMVRKSKEIFNHEEKISAKDFVEAQKYDSERTFDS